MMTTTRSSCRPQNVLDVLSRHMLVDGYHVVMDLERSRGSYLFDARSDRTILDFFIELRDLPIGYNHPKMADPEFRERLAEAALDKPANTDIYTSTSPSSSRPSRSSPCRRPTPTTCSSSRAARSPSRTR